MKILKLLLSLFAFAVLSACEDLSFSDSDSQSPKNREESTGGTGSLSPMNKQIVNETTLVETADDKAKERETPEEEITLIAEDFELTEDTVIKNTKVVFDMATIKTNEHDLVIVADEFFSNHSVIQNFSLEQKAKEQTSGKSGGSILIEAKTASGTLQVALNGESAGVVPAKRSISREERGKLSGRSGRDGRNAVYGTVCSEVSLPLFMEFPMMGIGSFPGIRKIAGAIEEIEECQEVCAVPPTKGQASSSGRQGLPGFDGFTGGDSGSFHLKALHLSDFQLTKVQSIPGLGSKGGKGSAGGYPGEPGRNGRDPEELCGHRYDFPRLAKRGEKGYRGSKGEDGKNGEQGTVCLESLAQIQNEGFAGNEQNKGNIICY